MLLKKSLSCLLILLFILCQSVLATEKSLPKTSKIKKKPFSLVYFKNETWKSRWKWNLLINTAVFSTITLVYSSSKQNFIKARDNVSLDEDKKVLDDDISTHDTIISLAGGIAALSLAGSIYMFVTDDSGLKTTAIKGIPELMISPKRYQLSWGVPF